MNIILKKKKKKKVNNNGYKKIYIKRVDDFCD